MTKINTFTRSITITFYLTPIRFRDLSLFCCQVKNEDLKERIKAEEKDGRTVFIGNLPADTTEKTLRQMFKEFGAIETVRFRGAARPDPKTTKKVAIIKRMFHEKHQRIIAYVR